MYKPMMPIDFVSKYYAYICRAFAIHGYYKILFLKQNHQNNILLKPRCPPRVFLGAGAGCLGGIFLRFSLFSGGIGGMLWTSTAQRDRRMFIVSQVHQSSILCRWILLLFCTGASFLEVVWLYVTRCLYISWSL